MKEKKGLKIRIMKTIHLIDIAKYILNFPPQNCPQFNKKSYICTILKTGI